MKLLFINLPYHGHVIPTVGLVQELVRQGCDVTYLLPFGWEEQVAESGAVFCGYQNHRQLSEQMKNAYRAADQIAGSFDGIVYEQFFFLGKHLAQKHHKPAVRIFTAPVTNEKLMREYITAKGPLSIFKNKWIGRAFTKDIIKNAAKGVFMKTDNWLDEIVWNPPDLNLVYTLYEYQPYAEEFPEEQYKFLGPSVYERKEEELEFQKNSRPVVYISLGTILKGKESFFEKCMTAFRGEDIDVIISTGKKFKIRKFKDIPENMHMYPYVPQLSALKLADVFVTHGGMNSVSEALACGTPMVVIPFVSDQPVNARCVEKLGVGKTLKVSEVTADRLKETVFSVLEDDRFKRNMASVKDMIKKAPGNQGGTQYIIKYILEGEYDGQDKAG